MAVHVPPHPTVHVLAESSSEGKKPWTVSHTSNVGGVCFHGRRGHFETLAGLVFAAHA